MANDMALLNQLKGSAVARLTVYDLSVIPLFLLMGQFATQGGLSRSLFKAAAAFVGHIRGGLAMAAILSAAAFGAVCGSSVATAATITQVAYPEMRAHGYHGRLATATLAVGRHAGHPDPAVGAAGGVCHPDRAEHRQALRRGHGAGVDRDVRLPASSSPSPAGCARTWRSPASRCRWPQRWQALLGIWPIVTIFVVVFGGIYGGVFSPTEGAAVGAVGTFVASLAQRELDLRGIQRSFVGTAETSAMVFMIFLGADMLNSALSLTQMPARWPTGSATCRCRRCSSSAACCCSTWCWAA